MMFRNLLPRLRNNVTRSRDVKRRLSTNAPNRRARTGQGLKQGTKPPFSA